MVNPLFLIIVALIVWFVGRVFFKIKYAECFEIFARHLDSIRKKRMESYQNVHFCFIILFNLFRNSITGIRKLDECFEYINGYHFNTNIYLFFYIINSDLETKAKIFRG